ncbi:MAG: hypothetical protein AAF483_27675, partial [Planctomycetota bacterium]
EDSFSKRAAELAGLAPYEEGVSAVGIPVRKKDSLINLKYRVAIPGDARIAVRVRLDIQEDFKLDEQLALDASLAFRGKHPFTQYLAPGEHLLQICFDYRKARESTNSKKSKSSTSLTEAGDAQDRTQFPYFLLNVDEKEVCRLTSEIEEINGYSMSGQPLHIQRNIASGRRLPRFVKISPSETGVEISVELIDLDHESEKSGS